MESRCNAYERATENSHPVKVLAVQQQRHVATRCYFCCLHNHYLHRCTKFIAATPEERSSSARKKWLYPHCFKGKCNRSCGFTCGTCKGKHNTFVHLQIPSKVAKQTSASNASNNNGQLVGSFSSNSLLNVNTNPLKFKLLPDGWVGSVATDSSHALLATALIKISNAKRSCTTGRALLDSGSELNLPERLMHHLIILTSFLIQFNARPLLQAKQFWLI